MILNENIHLIFVSESTWNVFLLFFLPYGLKNLPLKYTYGLNSMEFNFPKHN